MWSLKEVCHKIFDLQFFMIVNVAHRGDDFVIEYLDKIETELENTLACLSGAQMGSNHEKKLEVENPVTHSL